MTKPITPNQPHRWSEAEDHALCDLISEDVPIRSAAKVLGKTPNSCIGRFDRVRAKFGWQGQ